jgi:PAS domain S-box-containing protein
LEHAGYTCSFKTVDLPEPFRKRLQKSEYDLVISDHNLGSWTGLDALDILHQSGKDVPFIVVTGTLGDEAAVQYIKRGASDYVLKNRIELLPIAVCQTLQEKAHRDEEARLREKIQAGKREWELTFDSVPHALLISDDQCRIHRANRAATQMFRLPFSELLGRPYYEVLHGADQASSGSPHKTLPTTGDSQRIDFEEPRLGKTFDATTTPLRSTDGTFLGSIHVLRDISDRTRAERALRHSEERYRSLVVATSQVVWSTDPSGEVVEDSPTWREFTGESAAEASGRGWLDAIHADDRPQVAEAWSNAVKTRSPYSGECRGRRSDGEYRDLLIRSVPVLEKDGTIREWVGTCTDVTDQRQLEKQFRQAHKMEAMGRLAAGISHDFNNLLGVIIGYSDLLLTSLTPDDRLRDKVEEIKKAGQRAASLTRQLLAFSRKQVLVPKILDLNVVVSETSKLLLRLLGDDIKLVTKLGPALDHVKADPTQIEQVIMNLAINARDAMPHGGTLLIETTNTELDQQYSQRHNIEAQPGKYVLLAVSDTGVGMDKTTEARIFEPFFTTKEVGKGTGLGLATVYGIVKQSGGYISVYSEAGKGTTFKLYMPRVEEMLKEAKAEATFPFPLGSETILLVEDEDSVRDLSHRLLESMGYRVMGAANGADAMCIAGTCRDPIQLLVTDVVMPGMNGQELAELLVAKRSQMKVLYVSGHSDDVIVNYALLKSGVAFLQKPFTREELAKKVKEVLGASVTNTGKRIETAAQ